MTPPDRTPRRRVLQAAAVAAILAAAAGAAAWPVAPRSTEKSAANWLRYYDDACDSLRAAAEDCSLCHVTVEQLNPYGRDLAEVGNEPWLIEDLDSDGDGVANGDEVAACTGPGDFDPPLAPDRATWGGVKGRWR